MGGLGNGVGFLLVAEDANNLILVVGSGSVALLGLLGEESYDDLVVAEEELGNRANFAIECPTNYFASVGDVVDRLSVGENVASNTLNNVGAINSGLDGQPSGRRQRSAEPWRRPAAECGC